MDYMLAKAYAKKSTSPVPLGKTWYITIMVSSIPTNLVKSEWYLTVQWKLLGESLNRNLMTGPDLMNQLIGVLIRF